jgi:hypothetical protein
MMPNNIEYLRLQVLMAASMKFRVFWNVAPCSLVVLMMEAVRTSEMSVYSNETTWSYIPEDSKLNIKDFLNNSETAHKKQTYTSNV